MAFFQENLIFNDLAPLDGPSMLLSQERGQSIPRQYSAGCYVYDVDTAGNFVPNTNTRTHFGFSTNDAPTTSLNDVGYLGTLADFSTAEGTDQSHLVSTDWQGGNYAPPGLASLVLGWAIVVVGEPRWNSTAVVAAAANRSVPYGGSAINSTVNSIPAQIVARSEQLVRNAFRNTVGLFIPNGNNPNCSLRAGKAQLMGLGAAGMDSDSIPQIGAKNGLGSTTRLREAVPAPGGNTPNEFWNRFQLRFGASGIGATTTSAGQQVTVQMAAGDTALTDTSSIIIDYLLVTDVAIILPHKVKRAMQILQGDGSYIIEERETWMGYRPQDRAMIEAYECRK